MEEERNYENLVEEAKNIAFLSFRNFLRNIGLNDSLFSHLFETNVEIDYTEDITEGECSTYDPNQGKNKDSIYIGIDYLDDMFNEIEQGGNRNLVILDIATSIVHELIHKCRLVTLKQEVTLLNASNEIYKNAEVYHKICKEINEYDDLLALSLLKDKIKGRYIPIKVKIYKNGYYTFVAYNKRMRTFNVYEKQMFNARYNGDIDKFMLDLAKEVSLKLGHTPTYMHRSFLTNGNRNIIFNSMDLYTLPINDKDDPINTKQKALNKLSEIKYFLHYQEILEETVTEVLSNMIIMSRNKDKLNIDTLTNRIASRDNSNKVKAAANFLNKGGLNLIKGFVLTPYEEEFRNVFYEYYKDDYNSFLSKFSKVDNKEELLDEVNDITDSKLSR